MLPTKKQKTKPNLKILKTLGAALENKAWEKVKIKGHVISDEAGDYEGMIGLEVLESYDPLMVATSKVSI